MIVNQTDRCSPTIGRVWQVMLSERVENLLNAGRHHDDLLAALLKLGDDPGGSLVVLIERDTDVVGGKHTRNHRTLTTRCVHQK